MKIFTLGIGALLLLSWASPPAVAQEYNYGEVLQKSVLFYETQQSGELPDWNRINWRDDAGYTDGQDVGLDLTGGWFDAGDHIKFGLPMAFSVTALNWGFLEFEEGYRKAGQIDHYKRNLKWVTDYFIKCHPSANEFYAQISAKQPDHSFWMPAEMVDVKEMYGQRESYKLDVDNPGTEVACETAAALASASMVFGDSDPAYSAELLTHAKELFAFGDEYRGRYTEEGNIPAVGTYSSGGYNDELTWGAIWLYKATGDEAYLEKARAFYKDLSLQEQSEYKSYKWSIVWDDKAYGCYVMMAELTGEQAYKDDAERHLDWWSTGFEGDRVDYSPGGLAWLFQWGSLRHAANAALTALIYSKNVETPKAKTYRDFAVGQIDYMLGDNPENRSYVTGFGVNPPTKPHHRGQHSSWLRSEAVPVESRHTLWGALVGGPTVTDAYADLRTDFQQNEVACDYNAGFQGAIAWMVEEYGGTALPNFPKPETPGVEFVNEVRINGDEGSYTEVAVWLNNRSGWPARKPDDMRFRYYFDISEGRDAGLTVADYAVTVRNGTQVGGITACGGTTYYVEVQLDGEIPIPAGQEDYRKEVQMRIALPATAPAGAWDASNDPSYQGLTGELEESPNVPMFVDGELVWGELPCGGTDPNPPSPDRAPVADFTVTPAPGTAPRSIAVDAAKSGDPDGDALTYAWSFGDGATATGATAAHAYDTPGTYDVKLTVTAKGKTGSKTIEVEVEDDTPNPGTNRAPVVAFVSPTATTVTEGYTALRVEVEASDPDGDAVTAALSIDGRPGRTEARAPHEWGHATSPRPAETLGLTAGEHDLTVVVTDARGAKSEATFTLTVESGDGGGGTCDFGTPAAAGLPATEARYGRVDVLGAGGPALANVRELSINWDPRNDGLYVFAVNTTDGRPDWYVDLRPAMDYRFTGARPEVTFAGSGVPGLDGAYWIARDGDDLALVSKGGAYTLYFSNGASVPGCELSARGSTADAVSLDVFPNPTSAQVSLRTGTSLRDAEVTLIDVTGAIVRAITVREDVTRYTLDVTPLPAGIYTVRVVAPGAAPRVAVVVRN